MPSTSTTSSCSSSTTSTMSVEHQRYQHLIQLAASGEKVDNYDLAHPESFKNDWKITEDDTRSIVSMKDFMAKASKQNIPRKQAFAMKLRQWQSEGKASWKKIQPYYEDFKYWMMMGPH